MRKLLIVCILVILLQITVFDTSSTQIGNDPSTSAIVDTAFTEIPMDQDLEEGNAIILTWDWDFSGFANFQDQSYNITRNGILVVIGHDNYNKVNPSKEVSNIIFDGTQTPGDYNVTFILKIALTNGTVYHEEVGLFRT